jgi:hypothetical protein
MALVLGDMALLIALPLLGERELGSPPLNSDGRLRWRKARKPGEVSNWKM